MRPADLRNALDNWEAANGIKWDTAVVLHTSDRMRAAENGWDDIWLQKTVRRYFNAVDRRIFKNEHKRRGVRCARFVTLERNASVGWHCHFITATPPNLIAADFQQILVREWHEIARRYDRGNCQKAVAWIEPITGDYKRYITKHAFHHGTNIDAHNDIGAFDSMNTHLVA